jgi:hypothetical protein
VRQVGYLLVKLYRDAGSPEYKVYTKFCMELMSQNLTNLLLCGFTNQVALGIEFV